MEFSNLKIVEYISFDKEFLDIIHTYQLMKEFDYIINYNPSNHLPYHGLRHTMHVVVACEKIFWKIVENPADPDFPFDMYFDMCRNLLIAALFHDFNHSGGLYSDDVNVMMAVNAVKDYYKNSNININEITDTIKATQFPHKGYTHQISHLVIRDADLSQSASDDFFFFVIGLMDERSNQAFKIPFNEIIENTIKFNSEHLFFLQATQDLYGEQRSKNMEILTKYLKIHEGNK